MSLDCQVSAEKSKKLILWMQSEKAVQIPEIENVKLPAFHFCLNNTNELISRSARPNIPEEKILRFQSEIRIVSTFYSAARDSRVLMVTQDRSKPYRCIILPEDSVCRIRIGRKEFVGELIDLSRDDFRLRVPPSVDRLLQKARHIELRYHGERWLVKYDNSDLPEATADGSNSVVQLRRVDELTRVKMPSPWATLGSLKMSRETDPRFVLAVMVAFIAACLALPGIGDHLGTAPRIKDGIHSVIRSVQ